MTTTETTTTEYRLKIEHDDGDPGPSPREGEDLGTLVLFHRRYDLPCEGDLAGRIGAALQNRRHSFEVVARWLRVCHGATVVLPVWGYDHSGFYITAGARSYPFDCRWDSGALGLIYDTPEGRELCGTQPEHIEQALIHEVEAYDRWARGERYGYVVERRCRSCGEWEVVDDGWGYDGEDYAREEGEAALRDAQQDPAVSNHCRVSAAVPAQLYHVATGDEAAVLDALAIRIGLTREAAAREEVEPCPPTR